MVPRNLLRLCAPGRRHDELSPGFHRNPIVITFVGMRGNQKISLGISAQRDIGIVRAELLDKEKVDAMLAEPSAKPETPAGNKIVNRDGDSDSSLKAVVANPIPIFRCETII